MKKIQILALAMLALVSCNKNQQTNDKTMPDDTTTVAQQPVDEGQQPAAEAPLQIIERLSKAEFEPYFVAEIDVDGHVKCHFQNVDDKNFNSIFSDGASTDELTVENISGRVVGMRVLNVGGGIDPSLFMIMEDGCAEYITLHALSQGYFHAEGRTTTKGIFDFNMDFDPEADCEVVVGMSEEGMPMRLEWEEPSE